MFSYDFHLNRMDIHAGSESEVIAPFGFPNGLVLGIKAVDNIGNRFFMAERVSFGRYRIHGWDFDGNVIHQSEQFDCWGVLNMEFVNEKLVLSIVLEDGRYEMMTYHPDQQNSPQSVYELDDEHPIAVDGSGVDENTFCVFYSSGRLCMNMLTTPIESEFKEIDIHPGTIGFSKDYLIYENKLVNIHDESFCNIDPLSEEEFLTSSADYFNNEFTMLTKTSILIARNDLNCYERGPFVDELTSISNQIHLYTPLYDDCVQVPIISGTEAFFGVENQFIVSMRNSSCSRSVDFSLSWEDDLLPASYFSKNILTGEAIITIPAFDISYFQQSFVVKVQVASKLFPAFVLEHHFTIDIDPRPLASSFNVPIIFTVYQGESFTLDAQSVDPDRLEYSGSSYNPPPSVSRFWTCSDYISSENCGIDLPEHSSQLNIPPTMKSSAYFIQHQFRVSFDQSEFLSRNIIRRLIMEVRESPDDYYFDASFDATVIFINWLLHEATGKISMGRLGDLHNATMILNNRASRRVSTAQLCPVCSGHGLCEGKDFGDCSCQVSECQCVDRYDPALNCSVVSLDRVNFEDDVKRRILEIIRASNFRTCEEITLALEIMKELSIKRHEISVSIQYYLAMTFLFILTPENVDICKEINVDKSLQSYSHIYDGFFTTIDLEFQNVSLTSLDVQEVMLSTNRYINDGVDRLFHLYADHSDLSPKNDLQHKEYDNLEAWIKSEQSENIAIPPFVLPSSGKRNTQDYVMFRLQFTRNPFGFQHENPFGSPESILCSHVIRVQKRNLADQQVNHLQNTQIQFKALEGQTFVKQGRYKCFRFDGERWNNQTGCEFKPESQVLAFCSCPVVYDGPYAIIYFPGVSKNDLWLILLLSIGIPMSLLVLCLCCLCIILVCVICSCGLCLIRKKKKSKVFDEDSLEDFWKDRNSSQSSGSQIADSKQLLRMKEDINDSIINDVQTMFKMTPEKKSFPKNQQVVPKGIPQTSNQFRGSNVSNVNVFKVPMQQPLHSNHRGFREQPTSSVPPVSPLATNQFHHSQPTQNEIPSRFGNNEQHPQRTTPQPPNPSNAIHTFGGQSTLSKQQTSGQTFQTRTFTQPNQPFQTRTFTQPNQPFQTKQPTEKSFLSFENDFDIDELSESDSDDHSNDDIEELDFS